MSEIAPNTGEGNAPDLSALLGSLGQKEGGPDLSSLLGMITGGGPEGEPAGSGGGGVDFASLLGMLGGIAGGGEEKPPPPPSPAPEAAGGLPFDPALLSTLSRAMKALREPDRNIQLLQALRPFLEPERQKKVDEAVKILHLMRLAPLIQESGVLGDLLGCGGDFPLALAAPLPPDQHRKDQTSMTPETWEEMEHRAAEEARAYHRQAAPPAPAPAPQRAGAPAPPPRRRGLLGRLSGDQLLLGALLCLLVQEEADPQLILAVAYILMA